MQSGVRKPRVESNEASHTSIRIGPRPARRGRPAQLQEGRPVLAASAALRLPQLPVHTGQHYDQAMSDASFEDPGCRSRTSTWASGPAPKSSRQRRSLSRLTGCPRTGHGDIHLRYIAVVGTTVVLVVAATQNIGFLEHRVLAWFGSISYSLYLWHYPVIAILLYRWPVEPPWVRGVTMAALSVLFASASYYLVERKFLRLKPHRPSTFEASLLSPDAKHGLTGS